MKKTEIIQTAVFGIAAAATVTAAGWGIVTVLPRYTRDNCKVTNVTNNIVEITDRVGNVWEYEKLGREHFQKGERVKPVMHDNWTVDYIEDDKIIKICK